MPAKFTSKIRSFAASSFIDNITTSIPDEWQTGIAYLEGDLVFYGNNKYVAKNGGTSGPTPPTHVSGTASDGTVDWIWVEASNINEMFKRNVFLAIGKYQDWDPIGTPDDADITDIGDAETLANMITLLRLSNNNFRLAIKRYDWEAGMDVEAYDSAKDPLAISGDPLAYTNPFFIITDENNIYKCLDNKSGTASTTKPTLTSTTPFTTADGLMWKYMGSVDADAIYFMTSEYVPVRYKLLDDGTQQWDVQQAAVAGSMSGVQIKKNVGTFPQTPVVTNLGSTTGVAAVGYAGKTGDALDQILLSNYGSAYDTTQDVFFTVARQNAATPGVIAEVSLTIVGGVITGVAVDTPGSGYDNGTDTSVVIVYDPVNTPSVEAAFTPTISSGSLDSVAIVDGGAGYSDQAIAFVIPCEAGNIAGAVGKAVFAPKEGHGHNIVTELAANTAIVDVRLSESSAYLLDDNDGTTGGEFRQVAIITDVIDKTSGDPAYSLLYLGPSHPSWAGSPGNGLNAIDEDRGYVLYINNIEVVTRTENQEEDLKIAITF